MTALRSASLLSLVGTGLSTCAWALVSISAPREVGWWVLVGIASGLTLVALLGSARVLALVERIETDQARAERFRLVGGRGE